jgi:hypothetical protein
VSAWGKSDPGLFDRIALGWYQAKQAFELAVPFHNDALHVIAGVVIQLAVALVLRSSLGRLTPWLFTAILALANEWSDLRTEHWPNPSQQWFESGKDIVLTLLVPTLLLLVARLRPQLLR